MQPSDAPSQAGSSGRDGVAWRLLVVEDSPEFLAYVRQVLGSDPKFVIVDEVTSGEEACEAALETSADAALVDLFLPGCNGVTTTVSLLGVCPDMRVILMSAVGEEGYDSLAKSVGARGFLNKRAFSVEAVLELLGER